MTTINNQTQTSDISGSNWLPVWDSSASSECKVNLQEIIDYIRDNVNVWRKYELIVSNDQVPATYEFDDVQGGAILYLYGMGRSSGGEFDIVVTLPPNPIDGQEVIIHTDFVNNNDIEISFTDTNIVRGGDYYNVEFKDQEDLDVSCPYTHLRYNETDGRWWYVGEAECADPLGF